MLDQLAFHSLFKQNLLRVLQCTGKQLIHMQDSLLLAYIWIPYSFKREKLFKIFTSIYDYHLLKTTCYMYQSSGYSYHSVTVILSHWCL